MRAVYFADCHCLVYVSSFFLRTHYWAVHLYGILEYARCGVYGYKFGSHIHSRGYVWDWYKLKSSCLKQGFSYTVAYVCLYMRLAYTLHTWYELILFFRVSVFFIKGQSFSTSKTKNKAHFLIWALISVKWIIRRIRIIGMMMFDRLGFYGLGWVNWLLLYLDWARLIITNHHILDTIRLTARNDWIWWWWRCIWRLHHMMILMMVPWWSHCLVWSWNQICYHERAWPAAVSVS